MSCTIKWNVLNFSEWEQRFNNLVRPPITQSYPYAQANALITGQKPRWGLIEINSKEAGLVQVFEAGLLKNTIHAVMLDGGPCWFEGFGNIEHSAAFFEAWNRHFPRRFGRKRRIIPAADNLSLDLESLGYERQNGHYETIWVDLRADGDILRQNLKKNWRSALQKAEKLGVTCEWSYDDEHIPWFLQNYAVDRETKGYDGPPVKLLKALAKYTIPRKDMVLGRAILNGEPIAGVLIFCHGRAATYQIGFAGKAGRDANAHHIMLWHAFSVLKEKGITDFDLGGINDETAKGVKQFKTGMGGQVFSNAGFFT